MANIIALGLAYLLGGLSWHAFLKIQRRWRRRRRDDWRNYYQN